MALYKGFSTRNFEKNKTLVLNDLELVKEDILNHIFTRRGERVMMPGFGTRIQDILFDPLDDQTLEIIEEDVLQVLTYDPRVELLSYQVNPLFDEKAVVFVAELRYIELNLKDRFDIRIDFEEQ